MGRSTHADHFRIETQGIYPQRDPKFCRSIGVGKRENLIDVSHLEFCAREDLNKVAPRVMTVLKPLKLVITNYPEGEVEWLDAENNPEDPGAGSRKLPFGRELYIEQDDFREEANRKFFRLKLGHEVRLKHAYIIKAEKAIKDEQGNIIEVHCTYDTDSRSGSGTEASMRKVKGTLHWVSAEKACLWRCVYMTGFLPILLRMPTKTRTSWSSSIRTRWS